MRWSGGSRALLAGAGLLALLASSSCRDAERTEHSNHPSSLVLCVIDTLREDGIAQMPHLRELAEGGTQIENAYATSSWTRPSLASIFTGRFPSEHGVHEPRQPLPASAWTLAEALSAEGYRTHAIVTNPILREKWGYAQGFEVYDDALCLGPDAVTSDELAERALEALEELQRGDEPFFLFLLFFDPHWQYRGRDGEGSAGRLDGSQRTQDLSQMKLTAEEADFVRSLYDAEVRAVDRALHGVLSVVGEEALVAVTADHGECLGERDGFFGHVENLREVVVRVPLILNSPSPASVKSPFSLASLPGLLWSEMGLPASGEFPSDRSVLFEVDYLPTRFKSAARTKRIGIREERWKLVLDDLNESVALYDLDGQGELRNLAPDRPPLVQSLLKQLRSAQGRAIEPSPDMSPQDVELLRALGYADEEQ